MTCRHGPGDLNCSSTIRANEEKEKKREAKWKAANTPDANNYEVVDAEPVGPHLVMRVRYPNCAKCAFEGEKVLVFFDTGIADALKWKTIDPHFRDPIVTRPKTWAPSPAARFPASRDGWADAVSYAHGKDRPPHPPAEKAKT